MKRCDLPFVRATKLGPVAFPAGLLLLRRVRKPARHTKHVGNALHSASLSPSIHFKTSLTQLSATTLLSRMLSYRVPRTSLHTCHALTPEQTTTNHPTFFDLGSGDLEARRTPPRDGAGDLDLPPGRRLATGDLERRTLRADEPGVPCAAATVSRRREWYITLLGILEPLVPPPTPPTSPPVKVPSFLALLLLLPLLLLSVERVDLGVLSGPFRPPPPSPRLLLKGGDTLPPRLLLLFALALPGESVEPAPRTGVRACGVAGLPLILAGPLGGGGGYCPR